MRKHRTHPTPPRRGGLTRLGFRTEPAANTRGAKKKAAAAAGILLLGATAGAAAAPIPVLATVTTINSGVGWWSAIPADVPTQIPLPQHSTILDADGNPIATFYAENRVPVESDEISQAAKDAIVDVEDRRFYEHNGVDPQGTARAFISTLSGGAVQGGSSITQQYVKNLLVANATTPEEAAAATSQTLSRKVSEAKAAINLEKTVPKDEILTGYLNTVFFGDGAYGIGAAAKHYFGIPASELDIPQSALLAGIINAPSSLNPVDNPDAALNRRNEVLDRMAANGTITQAEADTYKAGPLGLNITEEANGCAESAYPFYCSWVREILATDPVFGATEQERQALLYRGGLTISTPLQPKVQQAAQDAVDAALPAGDVATATAVVVPGTGHVAAIAQNRPYGSGEGQTEVIYPLQETFQQGSTFKPFTSIAAIEAGMSPNVRFYAGSSYTPENRNAPEGGFRNAELAAGGDYDMAGALRHSVNTWFVKLEDQIGVRRTAETAASLGITSLPLEGDGAVGERDASLTLGTYATSPLQVANAYATIAAGGVACNPVAVTAVTNSLGQPLPTPDPGCRRVIRESTADTVTAMLYGNIYDTSDPYRTAEKADIGRPAAGKTGTADSSSSVWFAGFTPQYASAVWIGDPRGGFAYPLNTITVYGQTFSPVYGGGGPALIWKRLMTGTHEGLPVEQFGKPGGETFIGIPKVVPNLTGLTPAEAARLAEEAGMLPVLSTEPGAPIVGVPAGRVVATEPAAGSLLGPQPEGRPTIVLKTAP